MTRDEIPTMQPTQVQYRPVNVQAQEVQPTAQPSLQAQPVEITSEEIPTTQPTLQAQPVNVTRDEIPTMQPTLQAQPVNVTRDEIPTTQPTLQAQPVNVTRDEIPTTQPTQVQYRPVNVQAQEVQPVAQPTLQTRPVDVQPQNISEPLNVNATPDEIPNVQPSQQPTPQQFDQNPQQQNAQDFQRQIFQPVISDEPQAQQVSTGGEVFAANLTTATNDTPQVQQTQSTQAPDAPPPTPEDFDVPGQIVRQARMIRTAENTEMVIKLNPEHLGELTLKISVSQNGAVNASFHSDNAQVRTIIENSIVQLKQELNNQGIKVENVEVYAGLSDGSLMNGQGGQAWQQNRQQRGGNRRIDFDRLEREVDATAAPVNQSTATDGVDYSV
ncbi:MAG: flagellar hook-length control protein FliK [Selenomonadaceae bacterium]|nr:flagellar hook-length control protein FliK [Selenomonadaceae bacterium]